MTRFCGSIGFGFTREVRLGVWEDFIEEHEYMGYLNSYTRRFDDEQSIAKDVTLTTSVDIVADELLSSNFYAVKYVVISGVPWSVKSVIVKEPRITLHIGGRYNGPTSRVA